MPQRRNTFGLAPLEDLCCLRYSALLTRDRKIKISHCIGEKYAVYYIKRGIQMVHGGQKRRIAHKNLRALRGWTGDSSLWPCQLDKNL